jgi:hypothetical protein
MKETTVKYVSSNSSRKLIKNISKKRKLQSMSDEEESINSDETCIDTSVHEQINVEPCDLKDTYTQIVLREQYTLHKNYVETRKKLGIRIRLPNIPEDISENTIKFILHKLGDTTSSWSCKKGDLLSKKEGVQECKCFTSDGPLSFSPSTNWDVIYFLDARKWLLNKFVLYKVNLRKSSDPWKSIQVSKKQTFEDQVKQGRRPRIGWNLLYPQIETYTKKVFEGSFEDIFTPQVPQVPKEETVVVL